MLRFRPLQHKQEGTQSSLRPRQPQVVFVACHHGSCSTELPPPPTTTPAHYQRQTPSGPAVLVCSCESIHTCTSSQLCTHTQTSSCSKAHCMKKAWSSEKVRSARKPWTRVRVDADMLAPQTLKQQFSTSWRLVKNKRNTKKRHPLLFQGGESKH